MPPNVVMTNDVMTPAINHVTNTSLFQIHHLEILDAAASESLEHLNHEIKNPHEDRLI